MKYLMFMPKMLNRQNVYCFLVFLFIDCYDQYNTIMPHDSFKASDGLDIVRLQNKPILVERRCEVSEAPVQLIYKTIVH